MKAWRKDIFVYAQGEGNDVITDYTADEDKIKLTSGTLTTYGYSGDDLIFKIGSGTLTVKNAAGKEITIINAKGKTTTQVYTESSDAALFAENNLVTADNLSEIVAEKAVSEVELTNFEKISQENLITFAEK